MVQARILVAGVVLVAALGAMGGAASAQGDLAAFCGARVDVGAAVIAEDGDAAGQALGTLRDTAPPEVVAAAETLFTLFDKRGPDGFDTKKGRKAVAKVDRFVVESCGFPVLPVEGIDYEFQGIPDTIVAGPQVFDFTNDAPKESHELIISKVAPGEARSAKQLLGLPEKKAEKALAFVGAVFVEPGDTAPLIVSLEPGRYIVACFIPTGGETSADEHGGDEHGGGTEEKPHWRNGMFGEFEVVGGA